jgi:hypothetical protein
MSVLFLVGAFITKAKVIVLGIDQGVEQTGFQSSVSEHGVELLQISVRVPVVASNFSRAK